MVSPTLEALQVQKGQEMELMREKARIWIETCCQIGAAACSLYSNGGVRSCRCSSKQSDESESLQNHEQPTCLVKTDSRGQAHRG